MLVPSVVVLLKVIILSLVSGICDKLGKPHWGKSHLKIVLSWTVSFLEDDGVLLTDSSLVAAFVYYSNGLSERLPGPLTESHSQ